MIPFSSKLFAASFSISTLPVIAQDILFSNYIPFALPASQIASLVEKYGIESIKPLHEAGAKFSRLKSYEIEYLVGEYGSEIKDKLLHPESIQDEIIANDTESLTANNVEQLETISTSDGDEIADQETAVELDSSYTIIESDIYQVS